MLGYTNELISCQSDGPILSNSAVATSLLPSQAKLTLPPSFFSFIGQEIAVEASGRISNIANPGTLAFSLQFNGAAVAAPAGFTMSVGTRTDGSWMLRWILTARSLGTVASATLMHVCLFAGRIAPGGTAFFQTLPATAPVVGPGFDSIVTNTVDLFAQFGTANAGNSIQLHQYRIESLN